MISSKVYAATASASNPTKKSNPILQIFYFKDNPSARTSLFQHPNFVNVLAPQAYSLDDSGVLTGSIDPPL